ncbi:MAG: excinuclease ABC subunit UvrC [Microbacteriaceae bacterium]
MPPPPAAPRGRGRPRRADTVPYRPAAGEIPTQPGVYRFSDPRGRILYVGKAKNLRQRLSNYFAPLHTLHERTARMVTTASKVEWTVVGSEFEALQLEFTWIKEFEPPFNVVFRDDKSYPYLVVTLGEESPRVMISRRHGIRGARYFGPYPKVWAVRETMELMTKAFPIRTCKDSDYERAMRTGKPCFAGQIGACGGPCSQKVSIAEHRLKVDEFVAFLAGNDRRFITEARAEMAEAAGRLEYERAAKARDRIAALEQVMEKSAIVLPDGVDADVFGIEHDELAAAVQQFIVRGGRLRGVRNWVVDKELDHGLGELIDSIMRSAYDEANPPPKEVVVPALPDDAAELEVWLRGQRGRPVALRTAQRGDKAAVLHTATINAKQALQLYKTRRSADYLARTAALTDLQEALGMSEAPLRIECYDASHLQGTNVVASMVVFEDGLARKSEYRRFSIPETTDDTDSIYRVLRRRLAYLVEGSEQAEGDQVKKKFAYPPQLLIVDGGEPQVKAAARALADSGVQGIRIAGIAKRLEELWLPDDEYPVILPRQSEALFLIQRVRDEAHRFAITYQRQKRSKDIRSVLGEVPGLGEARVKALLGHFGSVARLKQASAEEIAEVRGIGATLAEAIGRALRA